jgi:hypothetical protein
MPVVDGDWRANSAPYISTGALVVSLLAQDNKVSRVSEKLKKRKANVKKVSPSHKTNGQESWAEVVKRGTSMVARRRTNRTVATAPRQ